MLRIFLFGTPRLERDGLALPVRRSKGLGLLAYLATTGQPQSRDALLALLWPEFSDADARNNLRRELSLLRAALGETVLLADRRQIAWGADPSCWVDVLAFNEQLALARQHRHDTGLCDGCAGWLQTAVALAGDAFLAGYGLPDCVIFEEWQLFQGEELRQQLGAALEALVNWHAGRAELHAALTLARRWQALDPLHEPARRALMQLYARAGQIASAVRQYEVGARLLAEELGTEPEPATSALLTAIQTRQIVSPEPTPVRSHHEEARLEARDTPAEGAEEAPLTSFVGRASELAALEGRLADPACRLISLIGPGGMGKTRLAGEAAARSSYRFAHGAAIVLLASVTAPAQMPAAIANTLQLQLTGAGDGWADLAALLRDREQLLVLDNLEQLLDAAPQLAELLRRAPRVKLLVTTRAALKLREEWVFPVAGLTVADEAEQASADAVWLFAERARQARPDFSLDAEWRAVVAICRLVDGMPLAIELAAAWTATLTCAEIAAEITDSLALLETDLRNVPERQRSVQAVLGQSWARLTPQDQRVLARLSLFDDSFTRAGGRAVANAETPTLAHLLDQGLLGRVGEQRYRLHPLVRSYATQRLQATSDEAASARAAYGRFYGELLCAEYQRQIAGAEQASVAALSAERENLRGALPLVLEQADDGAMREVVIALLTLYFIRGPYREGVALLQQIAAHARAAPPTRAARLVLADALNALGLFAVREGATGQAQAHFAESRAIYAELDAVPLPGDATDPEIGLGLVALIQGDYRAAARHAEHVRVRSEAHGLHANLAHAWYQLAEAAEAQGLLPAAHAAATRALSVARQAGHAWFSAYIRNQLGRIALARGRHDEAEAQFRASYASREAFGDREGMAAALIGRGDALAQRGDLPGAEQCYSESLALLRQVGDQGGSAHALIGLGAVAGARGALEPAWAQLQDALEIVRSLTYHHVALEILTHLAELLIRAGHHLDAVAPLTLALLHPASRSATTQRAQKLLERCEALLPAERFTAAVAQGRRAALDAVVEALLGTAAPASPALSTDDAHGEQSASPA